MNCIYTNKIQCRCFISDNECPDGNCETLKTFIKDNDDAVKRTTLGNKRLLEKNKKLTVLLNAVLDTYENFTLNEVDQKFINNCKKLIK